MTKMQKFKVGDRVQILEHDSTCYQPPLPKRGTVTQVGEYISVAPPRSHHEQLNQCFRADQLRRVPKRKAK